MAIPDPPDPLDRVCALDFCGSPRVLFFFTFGSGGSGISDFRLVYEVKELKISKYCKKCKFIAQTSHKQLHLCLKMWNHVILERPTKQKQNNIFSKKF